MQIDSKLTNHYDDKYFSGYQKRVGEFGGRANLFKFKNFITPTDCLSPLNDWTVFKNQFRTLNLGNYEYKT